MWMETALMRLEVVISDSRIRRVMGPRCMSSPEVAFIREIEIGSMVVLEG